MGLPARKQAASGRTHAPRLRLVKSPAKTKRRTAASEEAVARQNFLTFAVLVVCVALLGIGRIYITVRATEYSNSAAKLRASIKTERYEGEMLEVRQSALGSPSRITAIAGKALNMAPATEVTYLDLAIRASKKDPRKPTSSTKSIRAQARQAQPLQAASASVSGFEQLVASVMNLTAGEAQVLLVGDVGVASTR